MHTLTGAFDVETSLLKVKSRKRGEREREEEEHDRLKYIYIYRKRWKRGRKGSEKRIRRGFDTVAFGPQHNGINETLTDMVSR